MKLHPLGDRVLVKRAVSESKKGLIFIPERAQEVQTQGEVVAVGPGKTIHTGTGPVVTPPQVCVGDVVLFGKYAGTEVVVEDEKLVMLAADELYGVLR